MQSRCAFLIHEVNLQCGLFEKVKLSGELKIQMQDLVRELMSGGKSLPQSMVLYGIGLARDMLNQHQPND